MIDLRAILYQVTGEHENGTEESYLRMGELAIKESLKDILQIVAKEAKTEDKEFTDSEWHTKFYEKIIDKSSITSLEKLIIEKLQL